MSLVALTIIFVGVGYLIVSVAVTIYRQRNAVRGAARIDVALARHELRGCAKELGDVRVALEKHLEKSHYLLGGYDQAEAQRWADEGTIWRNQWTALGERCRFGQRPAANVPEFEELTAAWNELGDTATLYTKQLLTFGKEQAPRLDRVRSRINRIEERLANP